MEFAMNIPKIMNASDYQYYLYEIKYEQQNDN
jgi:hypothetical protein